MVLVRAKVGGQTSTDPSYYFLVQAGVYNEQISASTGVVPASEDVNYDSYCLTSVKNLVRGGILDTLILKLKDPNSSKTCLKHLRFDRNLSDSVADEIINLTWPIGKKSGYKIVNFQFSVRVASRR